MKIKEIKKAIPDIQKADEVSGTNKTTLAGLPAEKVVSVSTLIPDQIKERTLSVWAMVGDKVYEISYNSPLDSYARYLDTAQKIIDLLIYQARI